MGAPPQKHELSLIDRIFYKETWSHANIRTSYGEWICGRLPDDPRVVNHGGVLGIHAVSSWLGEVRIARV